MDILEKAERIRELMNQLDECNAELEELLGGGIEAQRNTFPKAPGSR